MRLSNRSLGLYVPGLREFVPARWTIPENPFLGPGMAGLRAFVPATFSLPPQPAGIGDFVRARFSLPPQPAGVGDMVPTSTMYQFPQNSVLQAAGSAASAPTLGLDVTGITYGLSGLGHDDCGCGCGGSCGKGMGQAGTDFSSMLSNLTSADWSGAWSSFMSWMSDPILSTGIPVWMGVGSALLLYTLVFSGGEHSRYSRGRKASAAARRAYA